MDEVEAFFAKNPGFREVIDFEVQVWWDQRRLGGTKIRPEYLVPLKWHERRELQTMLASADGCLSAKALRDGQQPRKKK